jgi:hypothetical protein
MNLLKSPAKLAKDSNEMCSCVENIAIESMKEASYHSLLGCDAM